MATWKGDGGILEFKKSVFNAKGACVVEKAHLIYTSSSYGAGDSLLFQTPGKRLIISSPFPIKSQPAYLFHPISKQALFSYRRWQPIANQKYDCTTLAIEVSDRGETRWNYTRCKVHSIKKSFFHRSFSGRLSNGIR
jgi:hypothetical protein